MLRFSLDTGPSNPLLPIGLADKLVDGPENREELRPHAEGMDGVPEDPLELTAGDRAPATNCLPSVHHRTKPLSERPHIPVLPIKLISQRAVAGDRSENIVNQEAEFFEVNFDLPIDPTRGSCRSRGRMAIITIRQQNNGIIFQSRHLAMVS